MRIEVSQTDIDLGVPKSADACPIAQAIDLAVGEPWKAFVNDDTVGLRHSVTHEWHDITLPPEVSDFVLAFDHEQLASPFTFDLPIDALVAGGEG